MGDCWTGIKSLLNPKILSELEQKYHIRIPLQLKLFIQTYNGGKVYFHPYIRNSEFHTSVVFSGILSFNEEDESNAFHAIDEILLNEHHLEFIPFGTGIENELFCVNDCNVYVYSPNTKEKYLLTNVNSFISRIESAGESAWSSTNK